MMDMVRKLMSLVLLALVLVACTESGESETKVDQKSDSSFESTPALRPINDNPSDVAVTDQPVPSTGIGAEASTKPNTRVQFAGISFVYPSDLISDIESEQIAHANDLGDEGSHANSIPKPIRFTFLGNTPGQIVPAELWIEAVREKNGSYYSSLPVVKRLQFEELETQLLQQESANIRQPSRENEEEIDFVNGSGVRFTLTNNNQESYQFQGLTSDHRYRVTFTFPLNGTSSTEEHVPNLSQLDGILETLYIDGAAEELNVRNCFDDAEFIDNITIPDGTEIGSGESFVKTWQMRNSGTCTWTDVYSLAFVGGDVLHWTEESAIDQVLPGEEIDISITLTAPEEPGVYAGQYQLMGPDQFVGIGPDVYYYIRVTES